MAAPLKIIIVGGGTAGWMAAAAMARLLDLSRYCVLLVESDAIGTVGVGEATLPQIRTFHDILGLDEAEFMTATGATIKLGIDFVGWGEDPYIHPFGTFGATWEGLDFHQNWLSARLGGGRAEPFQSYCHAIEACRAGRFTAGPDAPFSYAYHLDAGLYARFLRDWSMPQGVGRLEGKVVDVQVDPETGAVASLLLESGQVVAGDLFVDASGFASLLLDKTLKAPWEDWSHWLPCDRALAMPTAHPADDGDFVPYTRATAQTAGWTWRIPLQHRVGNGYVYAGDFTSDEAALKTLMGAVGGAPQADPRPLRFRAGRRPGAWTRNGVGIGLSGGFLEPLESTSIYLIQQAVLNLIDLMPSAASVDPRLAAEFNRRMDVEYERIRDFLILHYHVNGRAGEALWDHTRHMAIPDSLTQRIELFRARGYIPYYKAGLFAKDSWLAVLLGQGVTPRAGDPLAGGQDVAALEARLRDLRSRIVDRVAAMPTHRAFIAGLVPAAPLAAAESA